MLVHILAILMTSDEIGFEIPSVFWVQKPVKYWFYWIHLSNIEGWMVVINLEDIENIKFQEYQYIGTNNSLFIACSYRT